LTPIAEHIWASKYRFRDGALRHDRTVDDTWWRVAWALAERAPEDRAGWADRFHAVLAALEFLPAGRILAGAGTGRQVTLFNCFVMGIVDDDLSGIFDNLKEAALTMQWGGGVGYDFSALRPRGARARSVGATASGPVSFMDLWDTTCATLLSTGPRRGAMMATLRCDHPDIEEFVTAKQTPGRLRNFNVSVQASDAFMDAVRSDAAWPLVFPADAVEGEGPTVMRTWPGRDGPVPCRVMKEIRARDLWHLIIRSTYEYSEPGVLYVDRINALNNLWYREHISATNPCGEIPLPPYGACDLGSLNLVRFVRAPFAADAHLDFEALRRVTAVAVRLLNDVIDASRFPLAAQREQAQGTRRIGLGITGLADALIMLGLIYGSREAQDLARTVMREVCHAAYRTSIALAREKGRFSFFERERYLESAFVRTLPEDIQTGIAEHGLRNSHLLAIAPAGSISMLANNVSSGLEPVFSFRHRRRILEADGTAREFDLLDHAFDLWQQSHGGEPLPPAFVDAHRIAPRAHLEMQAALQPFVDNSVSKTINVPEDYPFARFEELYAAAYDAGLKGCTTFRPNPVTGEILKDADQSRDAQHCCVAEREPD